MILNELAQGLRPMSQGIEWFDTHDSQDQAGILLFLRHHCVQARAVTEDGPESIRRAGLRPTHTPAVLDWVWPPPSPTSGPSPTSSPRHPLTATRPTICGVHSCEWPDSPQKRSVTCGTAGWCPRPRRQDSPVRIRQAGCRALPGAETRSGQRTRLRPGAGPAVPSRAPLSGMTAGAPRRAARADGEAQGQQAEGCRGGPR
ncbi:DUF5958 family protein [Streptomyces sp. SP18CS02]|uniref:DUF5958 family protein n=1 Tax=Streptomyces sp. SP18CS02 TaxID=3002531 RepID=UPI002E79BAC6|nr:DUF5958 family protein [Streptomyces sp. SP18CS02]MEE1753007.1 DUF5958 family protein [Streptomyces sp. SP18CS02]